MNTNKIVISAVAFIFCAGIGFQGTKMLLQSDGAQEQEPGPIAVEPQPVPDPEPNPVPDPQREPVLMVKSLNLSGTTYKLVVKCEDAPSGADLTYKILGLDAESSTGSFAKVPPIPSGKYTVVAINRNDNATLARLEVSGFNPVEVQQVQKMSVAEFQALMLNQNDNTLLGGRNPRVAKLVRLSCVGLNEGDFPAQDIQHVRDRIANGNWRSATVTAVGYNERGQINAATIKPEY